MLAIQNRSSLCTDPNCDTKLLRMRQELQLTKLKLKQVEHLSRKQQLQLQGRLNLSNDFTHEERNVSESSQRNVLREEPSSSSKLEGEEKGVKKGVGKKVVVKDDSMIKSSKSMKKDRVSNVPSRPKSSLAFVQIETVI